MDYVITVALTLGFFARYSSEQTYEYDIPPNPMTFNNARQYCRNQGYHLAIARTDLINREIAEKASQASFTQVWLNAMETVYPWKWIAAGNTGTEFDQGCYTENVVANFDEAVDISGMSYLDCLQTCRNAGRAFAALQTLEYFRPGVGSCRCGNSIPTGALDNTIYCREKCPGDDPQSTDPDPAYCGDRGESTSFFRLLAVDGKKVVFTNLNLKFSWSVKVTNKGIRSLAYEEGNSNENYLCGSYVWRDFGGSSDIYALNKDGCHESKQYICFSEDSSSPLCDYRPSSGGCYIVHNTPLDWFSARYQCLSSQSDLAFINKETSEALRNYLSSGTKYWVSLHGSEWLWDNDSNQTLAFTSWDDNQPDSVNYNCMLSTTSANPHWSNVDCTQQFYFICQKEVSAASTPPPPTTPSTPQPPTVSVEAETTVSSAHSTETPPSTEAPPTDVNTIETSTRDASASSSAGWTTPMIVGVVIGGIVAILLLIGAIFLGRKVLERSEKEEAQIKRRAQLDGQINNAFTNISQLDISTLPDTHGSTQNASHRISTETMPSGAVKNKDGSYNNPGFVHQSSIPDDYPRGSREVQPYQDNNMANEARDYSHSVQPSHNYQNVPDRYGAQDRTSPV